MVLITIPIWLSILVVTSLLILACDGKPVFFLQPRAGKDNQKFTIIKFRTMSLGSTSDKIFDEKLITRLGDFLRKSSIDELPQVINVLLGHMNLIGPRPLYEEYFNNYTPLQKQRLKIKPGITGLSQITVRNDASWQRKLALDVIYVKRRSACLDMYIFLMTFKRIVRPMGITGRGNSIKG